MLLIVTEKKVTLVSCLCLPVCLCMCLPLAKCLCTVCVCECDTKQVYTSCVFL